MHRRATEQNLCSQFDDFCQRHWLRRREQDYDVTITVSYQTTVTPADEDQARDLTEKTPRRRSDALPSLLAGHILVVYPRGKRAGYTFDPHRVRIG